VPSKADIVGAPRGPETKTKVTQVTFPALNLFYPRSIKALSGVNEDKDNDQF